MKLPNAQRAQHRFSEVPKADIPRSQFNRSHNLKTTFNAGFLVPIFVDEALPGDTFNLSMSAFARLSTPLKPVMDNLWMEFFFFAVPYRLVWSNWEKFNGAQDNPGDSTSFLIPSTNVPAGGYNVTSLEDYLGLPTGIGPGSPAWTHSALWVRAYKLIYDEWFRDENLQNSIGFSMGDGPDNPPATGNSVQRRGKRHDYFTSCLPWPQKGTAVDMPAFTATIVPEGTEIPKFKSGGAGSAANAVLRTKAATMPADIEGFGTGTWANQESLQWDDPELGVTMNAPTINELRQAFQVQKLLERDARGGTRYIEVIKAHFGVTSPDARLQRPEYLGGGRAPIVISPIAQNSATSGEPTALGNLAAIGTGAATGIGFVKSFTEHCLLIGLVSAHAELTYQEGLERMWSRSTRYDFYWPALAQIGEQAVLNKEIYLQGTSADDDVFGYQERYAEYRYKPSRITGKFRSSAAGTLEIWHAAEEFGALPTLNSAFIRDDPPIDRLVAVPSEPHFLFDSHFRLVCARPMPVFGVPGLIDHF